jgi:hypothetical protein
MQAQPVVGVYFYRLQVFDIPLPPLRERISDVPLLADQFLDEFAEAMGRRPARLTDQARDALLAHGWPGRSCTSGFAGTVSTGPRRCRSVPRRQWRFNLDLMTCLRGPSSN